MKLIRNSCTTVRSLPAHKTCCGQRNVVGHATARSPAPSVSHRPCGHRACRTETAVVVQSSDWIKGQG